MWMASTEDLYIKSSTPTSETDGTVVIGRYARGYLYDLTLSNGTDATNDIDIATGECTSDDAVKSDRVLIENSLVLTKRLDAAWAVGTGNGGLDTGIIANGTYHVYLIKRVDTGVVDALFSATLTPTMPTGYTKKRRIGSIIRESAAIVEFTQRGNTFTRIPAHDVDGASNFGTAAVLRSMSIPSGIKVEWFGFVYGVNSATSENIYLSDPDTTDGDPAGGHYVTCTSPAAAVPVGTIAHVVTDSAKGLRSRHNVGNGNTSFYLITHGWIDERSV
jgi:hypothetical protein